MDHLQSELIKMAGDLIPRVVVLFILLHELIVPLIQGPGMLNDLK